MNCETCAYYCYDEEDETYYCEADMDQDDYERFEQSGHTECRFYRNGDEYAVVRHQI